MRRRAPVHLAEGTPLPDPRPAPPEGLVAVGGDLRPARLLEAYGKGIFPWYDEFSPILWWSPDPRFLLYPREFRMTRSLRQRIRSGRFQVRFDTAFAEVIRMCATIKPRLREGTWITPEVEHAYLLMHRLGYAHSVEAWRGDFLAGGLYGVSLGHAFFGESMFSRESDASKVALATLAAQVDAWGFDFIDCQLPTPHLHRLGGRAVRRDRFLEELAEALRGPTRRGPWKLEIDPRAPAKMGA